MWLGITKAEISKRLPGINPAEAEKMASDITVLAAQYDIDTDEIINLLDMKVEDLERKIDEVGTQRQQLKMDLRNRVLTG
jgi:hypothetical protein